MILHAGPTREPDRDDTEDTNGPGDWLPNRRSVRAI